MKNKWVAKGEGGVLVRGANGGDGAVEDAAKELLKKVEGGETLGDQQAKDLKRRKLVTQVRVLPVCTLLLLCLPCCVFWLAAGCV